MSAFFSQGLESSRGLVIFLAMDLPKWESFVAASGVPSARLHWPDGRSQLLHSAIDPLREVEDLPLPEIWGDVILCVGVGYGYHLLKLKEHPKALHIVLSDAWAEGLAVVAKFFAGSMHKVTTVLLPQGLLADSSWADGRVVQVIRHPASYRACRILYDAYLDMIFTPMRSEISAVGVAGEKTERVLLLHRFHFLQEELKHALEESATPHLVLSYEDQMGGVDWESLILKAIQTFKPTRILSVNMKGIDPEGVLIESARRMGVAVHCWFVDDPRPIALAFRPNVYPWIHAWCWERHYLPWLKEKGFNAPRWLPLAGDAQIFAPPAGSAVVPPSYGVVFTGSAMDSRFLETIRQRFLYDPRMAPLIEKRAEELWRNLRSHEHILEGFPLPFQDERNITWLECLIQHTASQKKRKMGLSPLMAEGLICAGDPAGWQELLGSGVACLPELSYRNSLADHYRRCMVNLNVTSCQMPTAVNQRVFDVPLAGAFLLTDSQSDLRELFEESELAVYHHELELVEKSRWFLDHPTERERISKAAKARILAEHTYKHRLQEIFRSSAV